MVDKRIAELLELAATERIVLPYSPRIILALENNGHVVDLTTGHIVPGGANYTVTLTTVGEAEFFVAALKWRGSWGTE